MRSLKSKLFITLISFLMRIWFNWPGIPRGNNFYDGHHELFSGDP